VVARRAQNRIRTGSAAESETARVYVRTEIYVMNADGSGQRRLAYGAQPRWSPDGRKIAYLKSGPLIGGLYVMNADGSAQQRLARNAGGIAWLPGPE
jgi:TolB protein